MNQILFNCFQVLFISIVINIYVSANPGVERILLQTKNTHPKPNPSAVPLVDSDIGKCWREVPTASLVKDNNNIPRGNSSKPSFSTVQVCCDGYQTNAHNSSICEPVCKDKCNNGNCVAPDICECVSGYVQNLGGYCIPTCPTACPHGYCDYTGVCKCSSAYQLDPTGKFCIPKCLRDCGLNANCTQPGSCECLPGFMLSSSQICEPYCYPDCGNGRCVAPGKCECQSNFMVIDHVCQADCPRGCLGGRCVTPNVCECKANYTLNADGNVCEAKCSGTCENGYCLQPDICSCHQGYYMSVTTNQCTPICKKCRFGTCTKPGVCECPDGWSPDKSGLDCDKRVWLRMCPSDHKIEDGKCIPHCIGGCQNGACVAPHTCKCNDGYQLERDTCIKIEVKNSSTFFSNQQRNSFDNQQAQSVNNRQVSPYTQNRPSIAKGSYFNTESPSRTHLIHAEQPIYQVAEDVYQVDSIPASNYPRQQDPNAPYNREYRQSQQNYQQQRYSQEQNSENNRPPYSPPQQSYENNIQREYNYQHSYNQQNSRNPSRPEEHHVTSRPEPNYQQRYSSVDSQRQSSHQNYQHQASYSNNHHEQGHYQSSQQERPASHPTYVNYSDRSENPSRSYSQETTPSYQYHPQTTENRQISHSGRSQSYTQYNQPQTPQRQEGPIYVSNQNHQDRRFHPEHQEPRGPLCEPNCVNGVCTDQNTCDCNIGYRIRSDTNNYCEPICYECQQELCISPYNCACPAGYRKNMEGRCDRIY